MTFGEKKTQNIFSDEDISKIRFGSEENEQQKQ